MKRTVPLPVYKIPWWKEGLQPSRRTVPGQAEAAERKFQPRLKRAAVVL
jgi:hypothetical protein